MWLLKHTCTCNKHTAILCMYMYNNVCVFHACMVLLSASCHGIDCEGTINVTKYFDKCIGKNDVYMYMYVWGGGCRRYVLSSAMFRRQLVSCYTHTHTHTDRFFVIINFDFWQFCVCACHTCVIDGFVKKVNISSLHVYNENLLCTITCTCTNMFYLSFHNSRSHVNYC